MNIFQVVIEALESLISNKLRSALTALGIIIGVAAVVALLALGDGTKNAITADIQNEGVNLLFVSRDDTVTNAEPLTLDDLDAVSEASAVDVATGILNARAEVVYKDQSSSATLLGVMPEFADLQSLTITEGEFISEIDVKGKASVVVIGVDVADDLFDTRLGLIGQTIRINGQPMKIIGVLEEEGSTGFSSSDDRVLVPLTTAQARLIHRDTHNEIDVMFVQAESEEVIEKAEDEISDILRIQHRTAAGEDDFSITSQTSLVETATAVIGTLTIFLGGVGGISLLVGGIGIMNIMLVSVIERTREIGLRKAMGARRVDILLQFLVESSLISLGGGFLGIGLGWMVSGLVGKYASIGGTPIDPVVEPDAVLLAVAFSTIVGVFFGLYPANRAAGLEPVEALRTE